MVKVFTPNKNGKIEFTKDELEKLLNEVWWEGKKTNAYYWTSPAYYGTTTAQSGTITAWNSSTGTTIPNTSKSVTVNMIEPGTDPACEPDGASP